MIIRQISPGRRYFNSRPLEQPKQRSFKKLFVVILAITVVCISWLFLGTSHASPIGVPVKSGWSGYCLDDYRDKTVADNQVDIWPCNNTQAQDWALSLTQIRHGTSQCLTVNTAAKIDLDDCSDSANQVWLKDSDGYINPNSGLCLGAPSASQGALLELQICSDLSSSSRAWSTSFDYVNYKCGNDQASSVACYAVKEWMSWQANPADHGAMLNNYTGQAAYEEWCADFVSYVFKEAGYPFTNGNYAGWDENIASQIQNQGFTYHDANGYTPHVGDEAFFDYPGGHVEIVVSGGKSPTFVFGNSNFTDPTTGNGGMATNTRLSDSSLGVVQYYLSPNSST